MGSTQYRFIFTAMGGENELLFYAKTAAFAQNAAQLAMREVLRIEHKFSRYRSDSVISQINRMAGYGAIKIDPETSALFNHASVLHDLSNGLFDITSGVLRNAWNFKSKVPPTAEAISKILPLIGWNKVARSPDSLMLLQTGMEVDFGGIGKEYATDRATSVLKQYGIESGVVNLGGDISVIGPHPDGSPWDVHIAHPRNPNAIMTTLKVFKGSVATSGDYQRFYEYEGKRYCHIINPKTGQPVAYWQSASCYSEFCIDAGSITTISMLLEKNAQSFHEEKNHHYLLIDPHGVLIRSKHLS